MTRRGCGRTLYRPFAATALAAVGFADRSFLGPCCAVTAAGQAAQLVDWRTRALGQADHQAPCRIPRQRLRATNTYTTSLPWLPWAQIRKLDSSTKWLVTLAQTTAILVRRDVVGPYLTVGAILASLLTSIIKKVINQRRPAGAPFTDPGMPSSHALVSSFVASAWAIQLKSQCFTVVLLAAAAVISVLRVLCGHHSWAQILVGLMMGPIMAAAWMGLGARVVLQHPSPYVVAAVYFCYLAGSVLFVSRQLRRGKIGQAANVDVM